MRRRTRLAVAVLVALFAAPAFGATLQGVTFPDTVTVGGKTVTLNGMGVRVAYMFAKVYVAGLYLEHPTHGGPAAIQGDEPKRIQLQFLREVTHEEMVDAMNEGFAHTAKATPALQPQIDTFAGYFTEPFAEGGGATFDYVPGTGTTVTLNGKEKGTIPGADFMRALWGIWLGGSPPSAALKEGMLGDE